MINILFKCCNVTAKRFIYKKNFNQLKRYDWKGNYIYVFKEGIKKPPNKSLKTLKINYDKCHTFLIKQYLELGFTTSNAQY